MLTALGKVIAQSLQRALLYDQEHELAAGLQTAMLPGRLPDAPGLSLATRYRPTRARGSIGGDWYDALTLPDGRIAAVIGDVQGHDVTAAAIMGQLRVALRAYAAEGHPPTTVMARTSVFLTELATDRFATCLIALLDPRTGMTSIVRAGHPEPLVRRSDGSSAWIDIPGGLPLGLAAQDALPVYPASETVLEPGSTLVLCTDGLVEARAEDIDEGRSRLLRALRTGPEQPDDLADHLLHSMADYTGEEDDVALLILRRSSGRPVPAPQWETDIAPQDPDALRAARLALRGALSNWSLEALSDTAELLACELVTNALLYTGGATTLTARPAQNGGRALRLTVSDTSPASPDAVPPPDCTHPAGVSCSSKSSLTPGESNRAATARPCGARYPSPCPERANSPHRRDDWTPHRASGHPPRPPVRACAVSIQDLPGTRSEARIRTAYRIDATTRPTGSARSTPPSAWATRPVYRVFTHRAAAATPPVSAMAPAGLKPHGYTRSGCPGSRP